jgi:crotonobetainyl-CoA:carnitine CoA-transferase CaiB-like acyl-CoA transferase
MNAPQGVYRVLDHERDLPGVPSDDWIAISVDTDEQWRALCPVLGEAELTADSSLRTVEGRRAAHDRIDAVISRWSRDRTAADAVAALVVAGVPVAPVVLPHQLADIETLVAREMFETVEQPVAGAMRMPRFPIRSSGGPRRWHRAPAPGLGQHNHDVLSELAGLSDDEIAALERDGVIGTKTHQNLGW